MGTPLAYFRDHPGTPVWVNHPLSAWLQPRNGPGRSRTSARGFEVRRSIH
jgi:hypothetical protein